MIGKWGGSRLRGREKGMWIINYLYTITTTLAAKTMRAAKEQKHSNISLSLIKLFG
jgi:hypothetical protein